MGTTAVAVVLFGWPLSAVPAQAADGVSVIATGVVKKVDGTVCTSGYVELRSYDAVNQWYSYVADDSLSSDGGFSVAAAADRGLMAGQSVSVRVECDDSDGYNGWVWYGGGTSDPGSATPTNSRTLAAGANALDFGTISLPATVAVTATGTVVRSDGKACASGGAHLEAWDDGWDDVNYDGHDFTAGHFTLTAAAVLVGTRLTVRVHCDDDDADGNSYYYATGATEPGAPDATNSQAVGTSATTLDFGTITVHVMAKVGGKFYLADGSLLPASDTGSVEAWAYLCKPGATVCDDDHYDYGLWPNAAGVFTSAVEPGTYDVWIYAAGTDAYVYPKTVTKVAGFVVPTAGLSGLAFRTALGPAAAITGAAITGTPVLGATLTAAGTVDLKGYPSPAATVGYQWIIGGQVRSTAASYVVQLADLGNVILLRQTVSRPAFATGVADATVTVVDTRATPTVKAKFAKWKKGKKGSVTVTVVAGKTPVGRVTVFEGTKSLGAANLVAKNKGKIKIKLAAIKTKGVHSLTVVFGGNTTYRQGSKVVKVKVK